jgi:hypothetical protein
MQTRAFKLSAQDVVKQRVYKLLVVIFCIVCPFYYCTENGGNKLSPVINVCHNLHISIHYAINLHFWKPPYHAENTVLCYRPRELY